MPRCGDPIHSSELCLGHWQLMIRMRRWLSEEYDGATASEFDLDRHLLGHGWRPL